jgi:hypothetical protein
MAKKAADAIGPRELECREDPALDIRLGAKPDRLCIMLTIKAAGTN